MASSWPIILQIYSATAVVNIIPNNDRIAASGVRFTQAYAIPPMVRRAGSR